MSLALLLLLDVCNVVHRHVLMMLLFLVVESMHTVMCTLFVGIALGIVIVSTFRSRRKFRWTKITGRRSLISCMGMNLYLKSKVQFTLVSMGRAVVDLIFRRKCRRLWRIWVESHCFLICGYPVWSMVLKSCLAHSLMSWPWRGCSVMFWGKYTHYLRIQLLLRWHVFLEFVQLSRS